MKYTREQLLAKLRAEGFEFFEPVSNQARLVVRLSKDWKPIEIVVQNDGPAGRAEVSFDPWIDGPGNEKLMSAYRAAAGKAGTFRLQMLES